MITSFITPISKYEYDALYRIINAEGRELKGLSMANETDFTNVIHTPNAGTDQMQNYTLGQGLPKNALKVISNKNQTFKQDSVLLFNNDDTLNVKKRGIPYNTEAKYDNKLQDW